MLAGHKNDDFSNWLDSSGSDFWETLFHKRSNGYPKFTKTTILGRLAISIF